MRLRELLAIIAFALTLTAGSYMLIGGGDSQLDAAPTVEVLHQAENECLSALVYTRTAIGSFRHDSISAGVRALEEMAQERGWTIAQTEDPSQFNTTNLNTYDVVVFLSTSGDVLDAPQEAAFESYISGGGGYFGIHSASNTEEEWAWYEGLVGAYVSGHPNVQPGDVLLEDGNHPSTAHLPNTWSRTDEWYSFQTNPRPNVNVLLNIDQNSYTQGGWAMGENHPLAWYQNSYQGGRSIYTALGHTSNSYNEPDFRLHLRGALEWAASTTCATRPSALNIDASTRFPEYSWMDGNTPTASWYQVVVLDESENLVYSEWLNAEAANLCDGETCSVKHGGDALANGDYTLYIQAYVGVDFLPLSAPQNFSVDVAPAVSAIDAVPNQGRPTISWTRPLYADWFEVYVGQPDVASYINWFEGAEVCSGTACSVTPPLNLWAIDGGYQIWMRGWSFENGFDEWTQADSNLVFSDIPAGLPTDLTAVNPTAAVPTLEWTAGVNAIWYETIVYLPGSPAIELGWSDVLALGCAEPGSTCSLTDETLQGRLGSGEHFIYVRAWGPGGFSTGGPYPTAPEWAEGSFTR